jgi:hypothetical protein
MTNQVSLSEVPGRFLDEGNWSSLRKSASQELIALTYINASHPSEEDPSDFFWDRTGTATEAVHCYRIGRSLLDECRLLLNAGRLMATGVDEKTAERKAISASEWANVWPMFATNTAVGPNSAYFALRIFEAPPETTREKLISDCIAWLKGQRAADTHLKRTALHGDARRTLGNTLTHAIFDAAYRSVFERRRGRPKKN